ncbi:fatty acid synthase [Plakobranchus ocellatus]|uniref:Fatty acid synthase n=1 Tax=Plakobranchus ocellatus TaxID=259542 RepID=A0AAV4DTB2_9GAST|nr:fatty acid synthase [Plakobranchus ocellatus]
MIANGCSRQGLTLEECRRRCPPDVCPACHNAHDSVTISGSAEGVDTLLSQLKKDGIFSKEVVSGGLAFHRPEMSKLDNEQRRRMGPVIANPKPRSSKWISTCFEGTDLALPAAQTASPEYFIHNTTGMVLFHQAVLQIPRDAIVIEIGPHGLLSPVVKRTMENNLTSLSLMRRNHDDNIGFFLSNLGKCYLKGLDINPMALHPPVSFPVPLKTPMISPLISKAWDHTASWYVPKFSDYCRSGDTVDFLLDIEKDAEFEGMAGHVVKYFQCE